MPHPLKREILRPLDVRKPFLLALASAFLAGILGGYVARSMIDPATHVMEVAAPPVAERCPARAIDQQSSLFHRTPFPSETPKTTDDPAPPTVTDDDL